MSGERCFTSQPLNIRINIPFMTPEHRCLFFGLRSLGVTIWELFELGSQPYRHYTDRQVLTYAVKEQQMKLPKPLLKVPLSERW